MPKSDDKPETEKKSMEADAKSIALKFVEVINVGDSKALIKLQSEDFTLIDIDGDVFRGQDGWKGYFTAYPKYKIHIEHVLMSGNCVAIIGKTTGSNVPPELEEKETVLWTAKIKDGLVAKWQIYSDINEVKKKAQESTRK